MTEEADIVLSELKRVGSIYNGHDSVRGGVVYKMGWLLNNEQRKYGVYEGLTFKDNFIYHCGDGAWETTPKRTTVKKLCEHIDYYYEECDTQNKGNIYAQWGII